MRGQGALRGDREPVVASTRGDESVLLVPLVPLLPAAVVGLERHSAAAGNRVPSVCFPTATDSD